MGTYLNPGNSGFEMIRKGEYVDKSGLITLLNATMNSTRGLTCISRPRRFGKSFAAQMLCAYYDRSCQSDGLFDDLAIAKDATYHQHLNHYFVLYLDITGFVAQMKREDRPLREIPRMMEATLLAELRQEYPNLDQRNSLTDSLIQLVEKESCKIVFIIDEWDAVIREVQDDKEAQNNYLYLLRSWFKNANFTPKVVAGAYMTGILPIKKDGSQSAISDFWEYSMLEPQEYAEFVGFTEPEVRSLCEKHHISFESVRKWYDGYTVGAVQSIYNPYSVMCALKNRRFQSYWKKTSAAETLMTYIDMDLDGLQTDIARLLAGEQIPVDTDFFQNDVTDFESKDDVLTLLIHLGYLTYEERQDSYEEGEDGTYVGLVKIPNEEVRAEFEKILRRSKHHTLIEFVRRSDRLLEDTLSGDEEAVASAIEEIRDSEYAPTFYNDEQSLRYVVKLAYLTCIDQYARIEELPSGHGIADLVMIPKRRSALPAIIIELKWNRSAEGAISQILERNYTAALKAYGGDLVLVGINYDEKSKHHTCKIERTQIQAARNAH